MGRRERWCCRGGPPGGHSNHLSCCCNKVYFLLKHLVLCLRLSGWHRRFGWGGAGPGRVAPCRPGLRSGAGRGQVEPPAAARKRRFRSASGQSQVQVEPMGGGSRAATMRCCGVCAFDAARGPRRLMRVGLALILVGHVNLLVGAVLHGTVLRHVANPRGAVTPEYTTANVISVGSGLLSVSVGLVALLASRNLLRPRLHWALLTLALVNLLLSAACSMGLLLAVSLTVANGGRRLIADCHPGLMDPSIPLDQGPGHTDCSFDPTRIYLRLLFLVTVVWLHSRYGELGPAGRKGCRNSCRN